jgi:sec-independent protein translocase protein TatA
MFGSIGMPEMLVIFVIALLIFGPRKLPELGRSLGKSINEFKKASNELRSTLEEEIRVEETKDQRAKVQAEQHSAVTATDVMGDATHASSAPPSPTSTPETTVSRTGTNHSA